MTDLFAVSDTTWPAAREFHLGPVRLRHGAGGGQRVSSAWAPGPITPAQLAAAEAAMRDMGQPPLFQMTQPDTPLDAQLSAAGYRVKDPCNLFACPVETLLEIPRPRVSGFAVWEPLAIMEEIWEAGGIGPARIDVMRRANCPKTAILGRAQDRAAGTAYVGIHDRIAMVHALEVAKPQRRNGVARTMMGHAGYWAAQNGATHLSVIVTKENIAGNTLYASLGMMPAGHYHYRILDE